MPSDERDDGSKGDYRYDNSGEEVVECRRLAFSLARRVFLARGENQHRDDLRDRRQNAGHALAYHEGLHIFWSSKASSKRKRAVLHQPGSPGRQRHHNEDEAQVLPRRGIEEDGRGDCEQTEDDAVNDEGEIDSEGVRGGGLDVGEDQHDDESREGRDGENGGLEVCLDPGIAGEAGGEVRCCGEEHVPVDCHISFLLFITYIDDGKRRCCFLPGPEHGHAEEAKDAIFDPRKGHL